MSKTRFTTCIPFEYGGSGNPSVATGEGVASAMAAALHFRECSEMGMEMEMDKSLEGKCVAVQGLGNVSRHMMQYLLQRGVRRIVGTDISKTALDTTFEFLPAGKHHCHHQPSSPPP